MKHREDYDHHEKDSAWSAIRGYESLKNGKSSQIQKSYKEGSFIAEVENMKQAPTEWVPGGNFKTWRELYEVDLKEK